MSGFFDDGYGGNRRNEDQTHRSLDYRKGEVDPSGRVYDGEFPCRRPVRRLGADPPWFWRINLESREEVKTIVVSPFRPDKHTSSVHTGPSPTISPLLPVVPSLVPRLSWSLKRGIRSR